MNASEIATRNPTEYFILLAPAVTLFLVLSARQSRISIIARENAFKYIELAREPCGWPDSNRACRLKNLLAQNRLLFARYRIIQIALLVICTGLVTLGIDAFCEYFYGDLPLLFAGVVGMGLGTGVILYEIARAADTLHHELRFCVWMGKDSPVDDEPSEMNPWAIFRDNLRS